MSCCLAMGGVAAAESPPAKQLSAAELPETQTLSYGSKLVDPDFSALLRPKRRPAYFLSSIPVDAIRPRRRSPGGSEDTRIAALSAVELQPVGVAYNWIEELAPLIEPGAAPQDSAMTLSPEDFVGLIGVPVREDIDQVEVRAERQSVSAAELECLAHSMYFEARGESVKGRQAVAETVLNRVRSSRFPNSICGVVRQGRGRNRCQYSFYCDGKPERIYERETYREIKDMARAILESETNELTGGAIYFHASYVSPSWSSHMQKTATIGRHIFYRESK